MPRLRLLSVLLAAAAAGACARPAPAPSTSATTTATAVTSPAPGDSAPAPTRPATAVFPFGSTRWVLVRLGDQRVITATDDDPRRVPHLVFDAAGGRVSGSGGCNRLMGSYAARGDSLTFGPVAGTRMACPDAMATEAAFTAALPRVRGWRVADGRLELLDAAGGAGRVVAAFTPAPAGPPPGR